MIAEGVHLFTILRGSALQIRYVTFAMIELQSAHTAGSRFGEGQGKV